MKNKKEYRMKKKFIIFLTLLSMLLATVALASCVDTGNGGDRGNAATYYMVRFNDNYSGKVSTVEVESGKTVVPVEDPTRIGYTFQGWYLSYEDDATERFDPTKAISGNVSVYAKWEKDESVNIITLKYLNYKDADKVISVQKGATATKPENPVYDEEETYRFVAWYVDRACTIVYDFSESVNEDITLYAGWSQQKITVKFDENYAGAPAVTSVVAELGVPLTPPANPERARYAFDGWYTDPIGGEKFDFANPVEAPITLYAHWVRSEFTVTFDLNGATVAEGTELAYTVKTNASALDLANTLAERMTYTGHDFGGWYKTKFDPNAETDISTEADRASLDAIGSDLVVYAKWVLQEYTVSFDYNYENAPAAPADQTVKFGKTIEEPDVAEREGYLLTGWFTDADCTQQFTFDMSVSGPMTLYARWMEKPEENKDVTVTYYYSVNGKQETYATKTIAFNGNAASDMPANPNVAGYYFAGWYSDQDRKVPFNANGNLVANADVYAKMLKQYTLEAEATNFEGKHGQGTSTNSFEEQMIMDASFVKGGNVSNGYFVRELYYKGAYIDFEIESAEAVDDAVIFLRVSSESYEFFTTKEKDGKTYNYLSDEELLIYVNGGEPLQYGGLYMPMANIDEREDLAQNKTPFEDMMIAINVSLEKGRNVITMEVNNNNNHGGTFHAEAPILDCMYVYSSATITMFDYEYYTRENVNRG